MSNLSKEEIERIKSIFNQFDKNNNGSIEKKELGSLAIALNSPLTPAELSDFFKDLDIDKSNRITYDEFIKYWNKL